MGERKPAVAGAFYPAGKDELDALLDACFGDKKFGPGGERREKNERILGGLVPHAGLVYSGPCAARLYGILPRKKFRTVVIMGPNHTGMGAAVSISPSDSWETPLGSVPVNSALRERLAEADKIFTVEGDAHLREHSVEVQVPFLQRALDEFSILPIVISEDDLELCRRVGTALAKTIDRKRTLLIASSDLNHYASRAETMRQDDLAIEALLSLSPERLYDTVRRNNISMCGFLPATAMLFALESLGAGKAKLLGHYTSGDILAGDEDRVVGYASASFS